MQIDLQIEFSEALQRLQTAERRLDKNKLLEEGANYLLARIEARFLAQVAPDGTPWIPSQAAIREHRRTLFKTGRLFYSLAVEDQVGDTRAVGTDVPYALKHQLGIGVIARPFLGTNAADEAGVTALIQRRVGEMIGED